MESALSEFARALGLEACAQVIVDFGRPLPAAAPGDAALSQSPATDAQTALAQMVRRGFDSSLVALVGQQLDGSSVARGLFAWDVLNGSLLPRDEALRALRVDANAVRTMLAEPGRAHIVVSRTREELKRPGIKGPRIAEVMLRFGAKELQPDDVSAAALERARTFARVLHRSHLTTMASFYLTDLVVRLRHRAALPDLIEVLLDAGSPDVERAIDDVVDPSPSSEPTLVELAAYARARTQINSGNAEQTLAWAEKDRAQFAALNLPLAKAAPINPRPTLAYADAAIRERKPTVSYEHVAAITKLESPWRYAFRVMTMYAATTTKSKDFLSLLEDFLQNFGNDHDLWYECLRGAPKGSQWISGFFALLVREIETLAHEPEAWKALGLLLGQGDDAQAAFDEIASRLRAQATIP